MEFIKDTRICQAIPCNADVRRENGARDSEIGVNGVSVSSGQAARIYTPGLQKYYHREICHDPLVGKTE